MARAAKIAALLALLLVVLAGLAARVADLPTYLPDSGDEWGNTLAPLRLLYSHGDPGTFFHPSLFYDVTAAAYLAVYGALRLSGRIGSLSLADLLVLDERFFVFTARAVSLGSAAVAMLALWALGRRLWNGLSGLAAAALLAVLPLHAAYSQTVRVDSLFLAVFLFALLAIIRALEDATRSAADTAAVLAGLAVAANYNGALLLPWLFAALWLRPGPRRSRDLGRAALLAIAAFLVACPFALLNAAVVIKYLLFIVSLSTAANPGMEGRGALFYVTELAQTLPVLAAAIAVAALATTLIGNRSERFVLSLGVVYVAVFSLMETKFDRFILPGLTLGLLQVAGLPALLARRLATHRWAQATAAALAGALVVACLATMAPQAIPIRRHEMLVPSAGLVLDWIGSHAPPNSTILVEAGVAPLLEARAEPGPLGRALRQSLTRIHPGLDQDFLFASFVGGVVNYGPTVLADRGVDFAVVSRRNLQYIPRQCDAFPDVCAVYQQLRDHGRRVYVTPEGREPVFIYDLRTAPPVS